MPRITSKDRAEEMNRLIVEQGIVTRNMKYGQPTGEDEARTEARAARLIELVELLKAHETGTHMFGDGEDITPERYVNERIASWLRMNPLPLNQGRLLDLIDDSGDNGILVRIGEDDKRYEYRLMMGDLTVGPLGVVYLQVPEGVAEHFRQQGRRQTQRALQRELGL